MPPRRIDQVTPGFYRVRLVRGGPWTAAAIIVRDGVIYVTEADGPEIWGCAVDDFPDVVVEETADGRAFAHPVLRIAWFGEPVDEAEWRHLVATARWASENAQTHPSASPKKRIDLNTVPIDLIT